MMLLSMNQFKQTSGCRRHAACGACEMSRQVEELERKLDDCTRAHMGQVAEIDSLYKKERTRNAELQLQLEELQTLWKTYDDVLRTASTRNEQQERKHSIVVNSLNSQIEKLQSALAEKKQENYHLHR